MSMISIEYITHMSWAKFWIFILGLYQCFYIPDKCDGIYGWIISQCGFAYVGTFEMFKQMKKEAS